MTSSSSSLGGRRKAAAESAVPEQAPDLPTPAWAKFLFWLWVSVAAAIALFQPFELGFYLDDWPVAVDGARHGAPFSAARFASQYAIDPSRPSIAPLRFALSSALADVPSRWQIALALSNIAVALLLAVMLGRLVAPGKRVPDRAFIAFALSWLALPWSASVRFWPVMLPVVLLLIGFAWLIAWLAREWQRGRGPFVWPGIAYLFLCTAYEGFYAQWIPPALIGCALCFGKRARWRAVARTCAALLTAQVVAVGWYFASARLTHAQKPLGATWPEVMKLNLVQLVPAMFGSAYDTYMLLMFAAVGLIATIAFGVAETRNAGGLGTIATELALAAACFVAFPLSVVAYALGGRYVAAFGVDTRVYIFASFWLIAGVAILATASVRRSPRARNAAVIFGALAAASIAGSGLGRMGEWAKAWRLAQQYLAEAPVKEMAALPPGSEIVYVSPTTVVGAPILQAPWDINYAMPILHQGTSKLHYTVFWAPNSPMQWDGSRLSDASGELAQASAVYIWAPEWRQFFKAPRPFTVARDRTITFWQASTSQR